MKIFQSRSFVRRVKKFSGKEKELLDSEIRTIAENPTAGAEKKGDLKGIFVHKFKIKTELYLLSYRFTNNTLELITIGSHENYYRDLKSYLKSR